MTPAEEDDFLRERQFSPPPNTLVRRQLFRCSPPWSTILPHLPWPKVQSGHLNMALGATWPLKTAATSIHPVALSEGVFPLICTCTMRCTPNAFSGFKAPKQLGKQNHSLSTSKGLQLNPLHLKQSVVSFLSLYQSWWFEFFTSGNLRSNESPQLPQKSSFKKIIKTNTFPTINCTLWYTQIHIFTQFQPLIFQGLSTHYMLPTILLSRCWDILHSIKVNKIQ